MITSAYRLLGSMNRSWAGFTVVEVLLDDALGGPATFGGVATETSDQADVGRGVDEDLQVEPLAQGAVPQHEDARRRRRSATGATMRTSPLRLSWA